MSLQKHIDALSKRAQFKLAIRLARIAMPIWENYTEKNRLFYIDSVVGLTHSIDKRLLQNTISAIEIYLYQNGFMRFISGKSDLIKLRREFDEPVSALQDMDWELPDLVAKTFYGIYNMIDSLIGKERTVFNEPTIYVAVNQLADALESSKLLTFDELNQILKEIKGN